MKGKLYGVGVGPGDPELITLKAISTIKGCDYIAVPHSGSDEQVALEIYLAHFTKEEKSIIVCDMPMIRDKNTLESHHNKVADQIASVLEQGKSIAFLTIGDPSIYSTYMYIHRLIKNRGFLVEIIPGVPSFCSAAAVLDISLCEGSQPLHIIPASYKGGDDSLNLAGTKVLMKSGSQVDKVIQLLKEKSLLKNSMLVERCGLKGQRVEKDLSQSFEKPGYFTIIVTKEEE